MSGDRPEPNVVMFDAAYPPPFRGGKEKQAHLLSRALRELGVGVRVLTLRFGEGQPGELDGIQVTRCPPGPRRFAAVFGCLRRWRAASNICHVHTPSRIGVYVGLVARSLGYRVVFKIPNENLTVRDGPRRRLWSTVLRSFDRLVVLDEHIRREYEAAGVDPGRIVLGSNGVVVPERPRPALEAGRPVQLLFLGRFVEQKGCRELLGVARWLKEHESGPTAWRLAMMGDGPLEAELRETIGAWGLADRVALRSRQDDVYAALGQADVVVVPSRREGMPNVVLEAMSAGVPVVVTDVGAVRRLLGDEGDPFVVASNEAASFGEAILTLMRDPARRAAYGAALHARARNLFDMPVIARQYQALYTQLLASRTSTAPDGAGRG